MSAKKSLKEKTNEVIADRMFGKAIADYGETSKRKEREMGARYGGQVEDRRDSIVVL